MNGRFWALPVVRSEPRWLNMTILGAQRACWASSSAKPLCVIVRRGSFRYAARRRVTRCLQLDDEGGTVNRSPLEPLCGDGTIPEECSLGCLGLFTNRVASMKITDIKFYCPKLDIRPRFVVKVETDAGIYGLGEAGAISRERALGGMVDHFRRFLIGSDPRRIEDTQQMMYRSQYFEGGTIIAGVVSAIEIALWDILGKHLNTPVWQLLGGATRKYVSCFTDMTGGQGATWADRAADLVAKGWQTIRFPPGMPDWTDDPLDEGAYEPWESVYWTAEQLRAVRERVGPTVKLCVDFHHRLSVPEAAEFCRLVQDVGLMFVEEPIRSESPDAYAALRAMTQMPFAIGEEFSGIYVFAPFIERGLCSYVRIDLCNVGGFTAARKVAAMAEAHYVDVMPHDPLGPVATAAMVHFSTAVPNFSLLEYNWHAQERAPDLFPGAMELEGDHFPLPQRSGLGIEINEDALSNYEFEYWEAPHLRRRDGSYTNW